MNNLKLFGLAVYVIIVCLLLTACNASNNIKGKVYTHEAESLDEYDSALIVEMPQGDDQKKDGYNYMSEFINGFSFVREQAVEGEQAVSGLSPGSYYLSTGYYSESAVEKAQKIVDECRTGYKFIDVDGNVIFDNLDADIYLDSYVPTITEPGGGCNVIFVPSYFTDYGMAAVKQNGKFGIINIGNCEKG